VFEQYIGTWTSGAEMQFEFTSVPEHFIFNDKLIIYQYMPTIYIYFPDMDVWEAKFSKYPKLEFSPVDVPILTLETMPCYIGKYCNLFTRVRFLKKNLKAHISICFADIIDGNEMVLRTITKVCKVKDCNHVIRTLSSVIYSESPNERKRNRGTQEVNLSYLLPVKGGNRHTFVLTPFYHDIRYDKPAVLLCAHFYGKYDLKTLHVHSIPIQNPRKFQSLGFTKKNSPRRFFDLINPAHLHTMNWDHI